MSQINLTLLVTIFLPLLISSVAHVDPKLASSSSSKPNHSRAMTYIESSCNGTLYPNLCIRSLSRFANSNIDRPQHLAHVALSISLSRAIQTRDYLLNMAKEFNSINENSSNNNNNNKKREYLTLQDCMNQINDSVDQLSQAIKELWRLNKVGSTTISDDFLWHISNVETWVGTALTDASSCVYAFPGHRMSKRNAAIKVKAMNVAQVTSNALALFHRYATKYREEAARKIKP